jgi:hypothetical protein
MQNINLWQEVHGLPRLMAKAWRSAARTRTCFEGCGILGLGFGFDDEAAAKGTAGPSAEMPSAELHRLRNLNARTWQRIVADWAGWR